MTRHRAIIYDLSVDRIVAQLREFAQRTSSDSFPLNHEAVVLLLSCIDIHELRHRGEEFGLGVRSRARFGDGGAGGGSS